MYNMLKICCNVLVMVGLFSCVFGDSEDVVLNKKETSQAGPRPARVDGPTRSSSVLKANTMSIVRKLSEAFRYSIQKNKAAPQYRWLSEGPNGLSSVSSRVETSKTSTEKDTEKDDRRRKLKNQFRLFHNKHKGSDLLLSSPTKAKLKSKKHTPVSPHNTDDGPRMDIVPDHILMARILRPKSLPPLAPNAKDISLIIPKRNRITKETGFYIFENLESLIQHNKLHEFRITPSDIHKV
ncbi:uncharacterized protein [Magallana gigas]|uniref:uncharacterized protein isoform X1 n=2 Tax=Magallana gigas TaxID=29159 RepID=UPI00333F2E3B